MQSTATKVLPDLVVSDLKVERCLPLRADAELRQGESLDKAARRIIRRKPCGPDLNWQALRILPATAAAWIHQQVAEPPGAAAVRQTEVYEPHLIPASCRQSRENFIQSGHFPSHFGRQNYLTDSSIFW